LVVASVLFPPPPQLPPEDVRAGKGIVQLALRHLKLCSDDDSLL
jgi:hypothetical protein